MQTIISRLTTRESARVIGCRSSEALPLLKAAGISHVRCGSAYLWDAAGVKRLVSVIHEDAREAVHAC